MNKKGQELPLNTIIIAIIVLIVLVVVLAFFFGGVTGLKEEPTQEVDKNLDYNAGYNAGFYDGQVSEKNKTYQCYVEYGILLDNIDILNNNIKSCFESFNTTIENATCTLYNGTIITRKK